MNERKSGARAIKNICQVMVQKTLLKGLVLLINCLLQDYEWSVTLWYKLLMCLVAIVF